MDSIDRNRIIANNIKKYIKENNITQKKLAIEIGISPSTMSDYMNARANPSHGVIQKIADYFGVLKSDIDTTYKDETDISTIYNKLNKFRKYKVYQYATNELKEQVIEENRIFDKNINQIINDDKVVYITDYLNQDQHDINVQSKLSAGTGIVDLDPENVETITYTGKLPTNYDLAFKVSGDSMEPLFEDGEIVFVRKQSEPVNGAIMAVQIDEEAFIKKVYVEADRLRFVSLNKKYPDFYANNGNDIRIIGKVVF